MHDKPGGACSSLTQGVISPSRFSNVEQSPEMALSTTAAMKNELGRLELSIVVPACQSENNLLES